jgi:predicted nuclease of predicted toxin-antitoxin system
VKLLFAENLSPTLVTLLKDLYPDSTHVHALDLGSTPDHTVWNFARQQGYVLVSKDSDFYELSLLWGHPPKVIWLRLGNCSTREVETLLRHHYPHLQAFFQDSDCPVFLIP